MTLRRELRAGKDARKQLALTSLRNSFGACKMNRLFSLIHINKELTTVVTVEGRSKLLKAEASVTCKGIKYRQ